MADVVAPIIAWGALIVTIGYMVLIVRPRSRSRILAFYARMGRSRVVWIAIVLAVLIVLAATVLMTVGEIAGGTR